jgi:hypothetical protein
MLAVNNAEGVQLLGVQIMANNTQSRCMQARVLGMLSPWLPPASVSVSLHGATFEHRSFAILTSRSQPWLIDALVDLQLMVMLLLHRHIVSFAVGHPTHGPANSCTATHPQLPSHATGLFSLRGDIPCCAVEHGESGGPLQAAVRVHKSHAPRVRVRPGQLCPHALPAHRANSHWPADAATPS